MLSTKRKVQSLYLGMLMTLMTRNEINGIISGTREAPAVFGSVLQFLELLDKCASMIHKGKELFI
jgi:hypothetical protein